MRWVRSFSFSYLCIRTRFSHCQPVVAVRRKRSASPAVRGSEDLTIKAVGKNNLSGRSLIDSCLPSRGSYLTAKADQVELAIRQVLKMIVRRSWPTSARCQTIAAPKDRTRPILLKNSLSGEKGGRVENVGLHNRATFNDLDSGKESPNPEKISFRVFQQNRPGAEVQFQAV